VVRSTHGVAYLAPTLPKVRDGNVFVADLGISATHRELIAETEAILGTHGLAHRKIAVDDELGAALAPDFRAAAWQVEELVVMPHVHAAPPVDISAVAEVDADTLVPFWTTGMRKDIDDEAGSV
jgi:hypothetical protein